MVKDSDGASEKTATQGIAQLPSNPGLNEAERSPSLFGKRTVTLEKKPVLV
jgi:hypothetical protein